MWLRGILALVVGVAVGVGAAFATQGSGGDASVQPEPVDCVARLAVAQSNLRELDQDLTQAERALFVARLRRAAVLGRARAWPDSPSELLTPAALRDHITEAVADGPGRLLDLDCTAYPCVASIGWEHLPEDEGLIDAGDGRANMPGRLLAQLQGEGPYASLPFTASGRLHTGQEGTSVFGMTWYSPDDYRASKSPDSVEDAQLNGTVLDQIAGRTEEITEEWSRRELP